MSKDINLRSKPIEKHGIYFPIFIQSGDKN